MGSQIKETEREKGSKRSFAKEEIGRKKVAIGGRKEIKDKCWESLFNEWQFKE